VSPRRGSGRKSPKAPGRRQRGSWRRTLGGLLVLGLAGFGVWMASSLVEDTPLIPRSLDAGGRDEVARPPIPAPGSRIRVEVLNAGGVPGVAAAARDDLRDAGFDVVHYGNASSFGREGSSVVLRSGDASAAQAVADRLGIEQVLVEHDPSLLVEVTVLLGSGWRPRDAPDATPDRNP
jgi:hypothetical protein